MHSSFSSEKEWMLMPFDHAPASRAPEPSFCADSAKRTMGALCCSVVGSL